MNAKSIQVEVDGSTYTVQGHRLATWFTVLDWVIDSNGEIVWEHRCPLPLWNTLFDALKRSFANE